MKLNYKPCLTDWTKGCPANYCGSVERGMSFTVQVLQMSQLQKMQKTHVPAVAGASWSHQAPPGLPLMRAWPELLERTEGAPLKPLLRAEWTPELLLRWQPRAGLPLPVMLPR
eukprot:1158094-Pelagomonas_calceolata.AAC.3